jgi:(p)ppGpp synthase/HD superfamily hydrolase
MELARDEPHRESDMSSHVETLRSNLALVSRAADYAARRHVGQRRKGASQEPYVNHLADVAHLLARTLEEPNVHLLAAAWLHDVLEDTCPTREEYDRTSAEIEQQFGRAVLHLVLEVTDDKLLPKATRKRLQVETTAGKSRDARLLKIADKTSNVISVAISRPVGWSTGRVVDYIQWAEAVVASCRGLNAALEEAFNAAVSAARAHILAIDPSCEGLFSNSQ